MPKLLSFFILLALSCLSVQAQAWRWDTLKPTFQGYPFANIQAQQNGRIFSQMKVVDWLYHESRTWVEGQTPFLDVVRPDFSLFGINFGVGMADMLVVNGPDTVILLYGAAIAISTNQGQSFTTVYALPSYWPDIYNQNYIEVGFRQAIGSKILYTAHLGNIDTSSKRVAIYRTANGGQSWTRQKQPLLNYDINDFFFLTQAKGYMALTDCQLYQSTDTFNTWTVKVPRTRPLNSQTRCNCMINFKDDSLGFFAVSYSSTISGSGPDFGELYRTTNGGNTWQLTSIDSTNSVRDSFRLSFSLPESDRFGLVKFRNFFSYLRQDTIYYFESRPSRNPFISTDNGVTWRVDPLITGNLRFPITTLSRSGSGKYYTCDYGFGYVSDGPQQASSRGPALPSDAMVSLYPNPVTTSFNLRGLPQGAEGNLLLYDMVGKLVFQQPLLGGAQTIARPADLPSGLYLYAVQIGQQQAAQGKVQLD